MADNQDLDLLDYADVDTDTLMSNMDALLPPLPPPPRPYRTTDTNYRHTPPTTNLSTRDLRYHILNTRARVQSALSDHPRGLASSERIMNDTNIYRHAHRRAELRSKQPNPHVDPCLPPLHFPPIAAVPVGADLRTLLRVVARRFAEFGTVNLGTRRVFEKLWGYWMAANTMRLLARFLTRGQPIITQVPLPDGSNLGWEGVNVKRDVMVIYEWVARRAWIRMLHFPGIVQLNQTGVEGRAGLFAEMYELCRYLLEAEIVKTTTRPPNPEDYCDGYDTKYNRVQNLTFLHSTSQALAFVLEKTAKVAFEPQQTAAERLGMRPTRQKAPPMTRDEIFEYNMHPDRANRTFAAMIEVFEKDIENYPDTKVMLDLLMKENEFEVRLAEEHVEDDLINKRIVVLDELDHLKPLQANLKAPRSFGLDAFTDNETLAPGMEQYLYRVIKAIGHVNRQRFIFRLLRDWSKGRPWLKMYQFYDTSKPENKGLAQSIFSVNTCFRVKADDVIGATSTSDLRNPSKVEDVVFGLFGILPFDTKWGEQLRIKDMMCFVCNKRLGDGGILGEEGFNNTITELHCKHMFHMHCLLEHWDQEGYYLHSCPDCGFHPSLNHEKVGIAPKGGILYDSNDQSFVHNVWGYDPIRGLHASPIRPKDIQQGIEPEQEIEQMIHEVVRQGLDEGNTLTQGEKRKLRREKFYNLPAQGIEDPTQYWLYENMGVHCTESEPLQYNVSIQWDHMLCRGQQLGVEVMPGFERFRYSHGIPPDLLDAEGKPTHVGHGIDNRLWPRVAFDIALKWIRQNPEVTRAAAMERRQFGSATKWRNRGPIFSLSQELAVVRKKRRQRDRARRNRVQEENKGLHR